MLAARSRLFVSVSAAPVVVAGQVCHVFEYSGQACAPSGSSSSSASADAGCATSSFCTLPLTSCANIQSNSTGCIATLQGIVDCDGGVHPTGSNGTSFQCICNNESKSCPSDGTPLSISFSNGSYSTRDIPASQSGSFSFTWTADTSVSTSNSTASATTTLSVPAPTAMTTFFGTFSLDDGTSTATSSGNDSSVRGQAAHAGNGGGAPEQAASTSALTQGQQQQQTGAATTVSSSGTITMMSLSLALWAGLMLMMG